MRATSVQGLAVIHGFGLPVWVINVNHHGDLFEILCSNWLDALAVEFVGSEYRYSVPVCPIHVVFKESDAEWMFE